MPTTAWRSRCAWIADLLPALLVLEAQFVAPVAARSRPRLDPAPRLIAGSANGGTLAAFGTHPVTSGRSMSPPTKVTTTSMPILGTNWKPPARTRPRLRDADPARAVLVLLPLRDPKGTAPSRARAHRCRSPRRWARRRPPSRPPVAGRASGAAGAARRLPARRRTCSRRRVPARPRPRVRARRASTSRTRRRRRARPLVAGEREAVAWQEPTARGRAPRDSARRRCCSRRVRAVSHRRRGARPLRDARTTCELLRLERGTFAAAPAPASGGEAALSRRGDPGAWAGGNRSPGGEPRRSYVRRPAKRPTSCSARRPMPSEASLRGRSSSASPVMDGYRWALSARTTVSSAAVLERVEDPLLRKEARDEGEIRLLVLQAVSARLRTSP